MEKKEFRKGYYYEGFFLDYIEYINRYYTYAFKNPEKCVFIDSGVPSEMILAAGLIPIMIEIIPTLLKNVNQQDEVILSADRLFFNTGTCSFSRFALPAFEAGHIPIPRAFVSTTVCNDMCNNIAMLANKYNVKHFCIDIPYDNSEKSISYLSAQYEALFDFLQDVSGTEAKPELIREVLTDSEKSLIYMKSALEMRKNKPALLYGGPMLKFRNINFLRGSKETLEILREFYEMMTFRMKNNVTPVSNEKVRILWNGSSPVFAGDFFKKIEQEFGAVIVADPMCCFSYLDNYVDDENVFYNLAKIMLNNSLSHNNSKVLIEKAREYQVDGVIHFGQLNCNVINSKNWILKNDMKEAGIPFLELTCDLVDKRNFGVEQLYTRIEAFIEMLTQERRI